jgi:hypothetical protein
MRWPDERPDGLFPSKTPRHSYPDDMRVFSPSWKRPSHQCPQVLHSRYFPQSALRALSDTNCLERVARPWCGESSRDWFRHWSPVMWIELREIAWLASIAGSLSIGVVLAVAVVALAL